jgi:protein-arginine kinase activator protein McsA
MKRIRIYLFKHPNDEMKDLTVCRNCGKAVEYGELINNTGHDACPECYESLRSNIEYYRSHDYERYRLLPHLYLISDEDYKEACKRQLNNQLDFLHDQLAKLQEGAHQ